MRLPLLLSAAVAIVASTLPASAAPRAFDPLTATYHRATGDYCIRSGWGIATQETRRMVRRNDCRRAAAWRHVGLAFDDAAAERARADRTAVTVVAAR